MKTTEFLFYIAVVGVLAVAVVQGFTYEEICRPYNFSIYQCIEFYDLLYNDSVVYVYNNTVNNVTHEVTMYEVIQNNTVREVRYEEPEIDNFVTREWVEERYRTNAEIDIIIMNKLDKEILSLREEFLREDDTKKSDELKEFLLAQINWSNKIDEPKDEAKNELQEEIDRLKEENRVLTTSMVTKNVSKDEDNIILYVIGGGVLVFVGYNYLKKQDKKPVYEQNNIDIDKILERKLGEMKAKERALPRFEDGKDKPVREQGP